MPLLHLPLSADWGTSWPGGHFVLLLCTFPRYFFCILVTRTEKKISLQRFRAHPDFLLHHVFQAQVRNLNLHVHVFGFSFPLDTFPGKTHILPVNRSNWQSSVEAQVSPTLLFILCLESMCPSGFPVLFSFRRKNSLYSNISEQMAIREIPELPFALMEC